MFFFAWDSLVILMVCFLALVVLHTGDKNQSLDSLDDDLVLLRITAEMIPLDRFVSSTDPRGPAGLIL